MRDDIQALRGWAVLLVVLDHAKIGPFHSGFLGVDIFFVISGYLITSHLAKSIRDGSFSFSEFYFKRARRILPAAYATIILTCIGSIWFLSSTEMGPLRDQVLGAVGFVINFVLLNQTDYFAPEANLKPLLHMWSLAIEEQFYFILPVLLYFVPAKWWKALVGGICLASLALCFWTIRDYPAWTFYMLPTRAWELAIGSAGALALTQAPTVRRAMALSYWPAVGVLVIVPALSTDLPHPGILSLGVCLATIVVIGAHRSARPLWSLSRLGDVSYSLYLVHWPIMVFANAAALGEASLTVRTATVVLSLFAAFAMYLLIENPVRNRSTKLSPNFVAATLAAASIAVASYFVSASAAQSDIDFAEMRAPNYGMNIRCEFSGQNFEIRPECVTSSDPTILVWGDSYAMHLVPGLVNETDQGVSQATFSACAPMENVAPARDIAQGELWAERCLKFNLDVLSYAERSPQIHTVILASPWRNFTSGEMDIWDVATGQKRRVKASQELAVERVLGLVSRLESAGKKVILFTPPPTAGRVDTSACVERVATGRLVLGSASCSIDRAKSLEIDAAVYAFADAVRKSSNARIVRISDALCSETECATVIGDVPVYRDAGHLSYAGSVAVMQRLDIGRILN